MVVNTRTATILVGINFGVSTYKDDLEEARDLVTSAGLAVSQIITGKRDKPDSSTYAGKGKVMEIAEAVMLHQATLVIFNHALSPAQIRNLENVTAARVLDRTDLILEIFAQRARSAEGKLQVELAQAEHLRTRLVRAWSHLEKQQGGIGTRGGPGEKQLEIDRQLLGDRIKLLKQRLKKVRLQRRTQRSGRRQSQTYTISIVGYTNAGKSTLFNRLTHANSYVADKLFATLDTTTRKLFLDESAAVTLSDTVGFIRDLPHGLVEAFRATLDEAVNADLLLHVVDAHNPLREQQIIEVNKVLAEIGAAHLPQLRIDNKADLLPERSWGDTAVTRDEYGKIIALKVSALTGDGLPALRQVLVELSQAGSRAKALDIDTISPPSNPEYISNLLASGSNLNAAV